MVYKGRCREIQATEKDEELNYVRNRPDQCYPILPSELLVAGRLAR